MSVNIDDAIRNFAFAEGHRTIYHDPNALIAQGFPASILVPLIEAFASDAGEMYFYCGKPVDELIGISHSRIVYAIAQHLGISGDVGGQYTGRGFQLQAMIDAIQHKLKCA